MLTHVNFIADQFVRAGFNCPAVITILIRPISTVSRLRRNCKYCILVFAVWIWSLAPLIHYGDVGFFAAQNASLIMLHKSRNSGCVRTQMRSSRFACIFSGNLLASADSAPSSTHRKHTNTRLPSQADQWNEGFGGLIQFRPLCQSDSLALGCHISRSNLTYIYLTLTQGRRVVCYCHHSAQ